MCLWIISLATGLLFGLSSWCRGRGEEERLGGREGRREGKGERKEGVRGGRERGRRE